MRVGGTPYRTIWPEEDGEVVRVIDQTRLPFAFETLRLDTLADTCAAIRDMRVRGAPLIGATAAWGLALAMSRDPSDAGLDDASRALLATRPTAVNLRWALDDVRALLLPLPPSDRAAAARRRAAEICDEDVETNRRIGEHGLELLRRALEEKGEGPLEILTHCNAGWLATVDWGTATAPLYLAHDAGLPLHVWVDETRPRNQGASLTAWELDQHGVPYTLVADSVGGHLMQRGRVDLCLTGTDRVAANGDVANKVGTYLEALGARDNGVPFWVAAPSSSIDWSVEDGRSIPIEERSPEELTRVTGRAQDGRIETVAIVPEGTPAANWAFDVTPARLVTGLITERGIARASREGLLGLFPERAGAGV